MHDNSVLFCCVFIEDVEAVVHLKRMLYCGSTLSPLRSGRWMHYTLIYCWFGKIIQLLLHDEIKVDICVLFFVFFFKKHRSVWNLEMVGVAAVFQLQNSWIILWEEIMLNLTSCATTVLGLSCCCGMKLEVKQVNEVCSLSSTILSLWISLCNFIQSCEVLRAKILCNGAISSYRQLALSHLNDLDFQES